jgi:hypothetical protein
LKEFVHGFFKIYFSNLDTKLKFIFDIYDFDKDGYIIKEDVKLILSYIPTTHTVSGQMAQEGMFTQEGGGNQVFADRLQTQEEIHGLLEAVFGGKKRLSFEQFQDFNLNTSSEMFLAVMLLFQSTLPCSENFNRYKRNYEKYLNQNPESDSKPKTETEIRMIASPTLMKKLGPLAQMNMTVDGTDINFNPQAQQHFVQNASKRVMNQTSSSTGPGSEDESQGDSHKEIPIANFRSNKLS